MKILEASTKNYGMTLVRDSNIVTVYVNHGGNKAPLTAGTHVFPTVAEAKKTLGMISSAKKSK